ncbi:sigma-70 family RNA polymerase sigma factor [Pontibacter sp. SD6]|uniref:Sigma-70 family RNA polymerase sigma factor n=1 Tax=Pontibacter cellulosilyticus TaxID=1720253 RepID=A0A923NA71_9BACT|nr:sigma-70 family RNA polymerase sigma factor [Pontibacter cellulosilyticus]
MVNLWKGLQSFKHASKLSTWIYRVSLNTAISKCKKASKSQLVYTDDVPEVAAGDTDHEAEHSLSIKALYKGIDKLKPIEKAIILLYLEEKSYQEIADIIGLSKENISVKLVRIKKKLEHYLKPLATSNR